LIFSEGFVNDGRLQWLEFRQTGIGPIIGDAHGHLWRIKVVEPIVGSKRQQCRSLHDEQVD
jgi:hypothetical protein